MKKQERSKELAVINQPTAMSLSELKAQRLQQRATNQRVEELKLKLFRITQEHMDQAVSVIRRWMDKK